MAATDNVGGTSSKLPLLLPATPKENTDVSMLMSMMSSGWEYSDTLRVLRQNDGDIDKAASAMLEGPPALELVVPRTPPPSKPERASPPVIDLTGENDDDFSRALAASLQDQATSFGPSDRAPDPNWAVVPSNVEVNSTNTGGLSQEEQHLNRAIEASLNYEMTDTFEEVPMHKRVRDGDIPVTLRPTHSAVVYAGLVLQGLFFVPQVKQAIARYRPPLEIGTEPPRVGPDYVVWSILELFVNMDFARTTELNIDEPLEAFNLVPWKNPAESPGDLAFQLYSNLAWNVETVLNRDEATVSSNSWPRLFHFRYGFSDADAIDGPFDKRYDMSIVRVTVPGTPDANDLLSCLALELCTGNPELSKQQVIFEPSEVLAFQLHRTHFNTGGKNDRAIFKYPKCVYLDQFMKENVALAGEKRRLQRELFAEVETLKQRREALTKHKDRDVLRDLRSAVHYYENIAVDDHDDAARRTVIHDTALKLRKILTKVENELQTIDVNISKQEVKAASVYDCPELQQHRYDLRVVLVHDGLYGRNHIFSYVKQREQWWKSVDYHMSQVSEESVFNDAVGLHLNAGPFMLLYSRAISAEEENLRPPYPTTLKDIVKNNNAAFLETVPLTEVPDPNSPPSTPALLDASQIPSLSSSIAEPSGSPRAEAMDID